MTSRIPGKILEVYKEGNNRIGLVEFDGKRRSLYLDLVPAAQAGDYVRFYAGFATERVDVNEVQPAHEEFDRSEKDNGRY